MPPGPHAQYVLGTRTSHGRAVRTAYRGHPRLLPSLLRGSWALHGAFLVLLLLFVVRQGGAYYRNAFGEKLVSIVSKELTGFEAGAPASPGRASASTLKSVVV